MSFIEHIKDVKCVVAPAMREVADGKMEYKWQGSNSIIYAIVEDNTVHWTRYIFLDARGGMRWISNEKFNNAESTIGFNIQPLVLGWLYDIRGHREKILDYNTKEPEFVEQIPYKNDVFWNDEKA